MVLSHFGVSVLSSCVSIVPMVKRVLIVDDDPAQRRILEEMIKRLGFETRLAQGGDQALQILEGPDKDGISLVLLDMVMPGTDGMVVLDRSARNRARHRSSCKPRTAPSMPPSTPCAPAPSTSSSSRHRPSASKSRSRAP